MSTRPRDHRQLIQRSLMRALEDCDEVALHKALDDGADPLQPVDTNGRSALMQAIFQRFEPGIRILLPVSQPRATDNLGQTALMFACHRGLRDLAETLVPVSDVHATNFHGESAFFIAARAGQENCLDLLLPISRPDQRNMFAETPASVAKSCGHHAAASMIEDYIRSQNEQSLLRCSIPGAQPRPVCAKKL